jgi:hypothetical protein
MTTAEGVRCLDCANCHGRGQWGKCADSNCPKSRGMWKMLRKSNGRDANWLTERRSCEYFEGMD